MENGFFPKQYESAANWDPRQLEIKYFWPLTEQIPLDLDYTNCATKNNYAYSNVTYDGGTGTTFAPTWTTISTLCINAEDIVFPEMKMTWYRKALFKLMGFKWKK